MTETEKKALALVKAHGGQYGLALEAAIEQHEAFKLEVSDAVEDYCGYVPPDSPSHPITRFILPKPDPLVDAMLGAWPQYADRMDACNSDANALRAALAARGLEVRKIGEGE